MDPAAKATVYHAKAGERKKLQLPDGSALQLNGGSTLTLAADFNQHNRNVYLSGEAYFEVAPDARRPFLVHTPAILIKVLGTAFNVKAYPEDTVTETSLLEGAIQVYANSSAGRHVLPEKGVLLSSRCKLQVANPEAKAGRSSAGYLPAPQYRVMLLSGDTTLDKPMETDWTRGRLTFNDQPFDVIARELERWYGVQIRFEQEQLKQYRFVATFDKENIDQVLRALQATSSFHYRRAQDTIILY
ncbi:FecR family protein [Chitinophaga japonensis]|uniref:FecR family protein n=1 Tax=Chitinophaga japonensis TaxID=104662 RepID=UPI003898FB64